MKLQKLTYSIYNTEGKVTSEATVEVSDVSKHQQLIAQTVRVFLANQRQGTAKTKTRGEVEGSTRKIYRQKGTGRARHGDIKAPIFVGGGIIFGPRPRDFSLKLNKKMKKKAFFVSVVDKLLHQKLLVVEGLNKLPAKTKEFFKLWQKIFAQSLVKEKILLINNKSQNVILGVRNLPFVTPAFVANVNTYQVLTHSTIVLEDKAVDPLFKRLGLSPKTSSKASLKPKTTRKRRVSQK